LSGRRQPSSIVERIGQLGRGQLRLRHGDEIDRIVQRLFVGGRHRRHVDEVFGSPPNPRVGEA
jgi:hypothetical protein